MRIGTIRTDGGTRAVRVEGDTAVELGAADVGELLAANGWQETAAASEGQTWNLADVEWETLVPNPSKVLCVGLNYRNHILEMGRDLPEYPTLFMKFADTLIGANDDIAHPAETDKFDWEAELVIVIGSPVRRASEEEAAAAIAGFTVMNDVTCRDWQFRTKEWLQGKNWDSSTPVGPIMTTPDELPGGVCPELGITATLDGETMQSSNTKDLLFDPVNLVQYVSTMIRLNPGDMIATGTPGGVGHARTPARYLQVGETITCTVEGIGEVSNRVVAE